MTAQRPILGLTGLNIVLLLLILSGQARPAAAADGVVPVLRGRALEIVDARGRVRASIAVLPADPTVRMPDGTKGYPETVALRLITSAGRPTIKIGATEDGSGMVLGGESDPTYVQILARGVTTLVKLSNKNGKVHVVQP